MYKTKLCALTLLAGLSLNTFAQAVPKPDHVVILMLENYSYGDIIGNTNAPYLNSLVSDPDAALFTQSFALTHPSQPNYVMLFSGGNQGIYTDAISSSTPFSTCNLGASLISSGYSFAGYSEGLPSVGSLTSTSGTYARKHCPWTNWQGTGTNQLPGSVGQMFTSFPTTAATFSTLPTVSFVIPNLDDDMHNPTVYSGGNYSVTAISNGDTWVQNNMANYIAWAKAHNSLFIVTFDEDDSFGPNQILTMFIGQMVQAGSYSTSINHYSVLRTLEDMYGLTYCDSSAYANTINFCWKATTGIEEFRIMNSKFKIYPNPVTSMLNIQMSQDDNLKIAEVEVQNTLGETLLHNSEIVNQKCTLDVSALQAGIYFIKTNQGIQKFIKQ